MNWIDAVDLSRTTEIERSREKVLLVVLGAGVAMIVAVALIAKGPQEVGWETYLLGGWMVALAVPLGVTLVGRRLIRNGWTPMRLSPTGLTWLDFSRDEIPWIAIRDVFLRRTRAGAVVIIRLDPDLATGLSVSRWQRRTWALGPQARRHEIHIANVLDITMEDLADLIRRYARGHGGAQ